MTLIANTINYSYPIIVGDILMSTDYEKKNTPIPTFLKGVDEHLPPDQKFFPNSLRQKIYVITDNLAIGFTGSEYQIELLLEDIKIFFRTHNSDTENIDKFFNEYDFSNFNESAYLAIYAEETNNGILINQKNRGNWIVAESPTFQNVIASGSGADYFVDYAKKEYYTDNYGDKNPLYKAISLNYINLCNLLGIERLTLETIKKYWGAGFEMIYFDGKRFLKMDNVTFIIWRGFVDLESEKYKVAPFITMNYQYCDDVLLISASDFKTVERYAVLPIDKRKEDVDESTFPKKPNFKTSKVCS